ncbi:aminoglycoside phosphotransferase family protein [Microlunatus speluncae]|uniref:aminoglycoside phosphotransferase family protein n=1 Tax=Microlunatus speluncae TaxID=2594267 RepID=UPI0012667927|nr:aminoglycoside phosphotransferase family protein [Microlunatus speluncae]
MTRLHEGQLEIDDVLVAGLLAEQFPAWAGLPITRVPSTGTVNALFRLGDRHCVRLPLMPHHADDLARELRWLPRLAPHLPIGVPQPIAAGDPTPEFPYLWAVYEWLDGRPYGDDNVADEPAAARDLAGFVAALRKIKITPDVPPGGRAPLREVDELTRQAIIDSAPEIDTAAALRVWDRALELPPFDGNRVWIHADLLRPNVLVRDGRLSAVIDFGGVGAGDPALDLIPAWAIFDPAGRQAYRDALQPSDNDWERGRAYALHQHSMIIPYYRTTNPRFVLTAIRTIQQLLLPT